LFSTAGGGLQHSLPPEPPSCGDLSPKAVQTGCQGVNFGRFHARISQVSSNGKPLADEDFLAIHLPWSMVCGFADDELSKQPLTVPKRHADLVKP
jgi:hypothetical protein